MTVQRIQKKKLNSPTESITRDMLQEQERRLDEIEDRLSNIVRILEVLTKRFTAASASNVKLS